VTDASDRAGLRLSGVRLAHGDAGPEVASIGLPIGAIQVPADGQPIIMLADRPVTGGYTVIATVIRADIGRAAQLAPGDLLRFRESGVDEALAALRDANRRLSELETIPIDDDAGAWAGALPPDWRSA
jgi:allophanate hydrolase subunit 2